MIKRYIFDEENNVFTNEIENISVVDYIYNFCSRQYDWKINYISVASLKECAKEININTEKKLKDQILREIISNLSSDGIPTDKLYQFCDELGIGVTKYNYLACGMTEKEYKKIYKKLKVIGRETIRGKRYKNLYSLKQYINYVENGIVEI